MMRIIMPLLLLAAAIGLFVVYTNPTYQQVQAQSAQASQLNDALLKAQQLQSLRDQLMAKRNAFAASDLTKLQNILPDNVDNIRLILDINNVAYRHGLTLSNLKLNTSSDSQGNNTVVGSTGPIGSLQIGFSVTTDYNTFIAFLQDLEHSERLIDITDISFVTDTSSLTTYNITFRTYWLH